MDDLLLFIVIITIFFLIIFMINNKTLDSEVIRVKSTLDDNVYVVRNLPNSQDASNLLSKLKKDILKFVEHMKN